MSTRVGKVSRPGQAAFTMVELMVAITIATVLIGACLAGFAYVSKSQYSLANYCQMDQATRKALELVGRDIRQFQPADTTNGLTFTGTASGDQVFSCGIPDPANPSNTVKVTYTYTRDAVKNQGTFSRKVGTGTTMVLIRNIVATTTDGKQGFVLSGSSRLGSDGKATAYSDIAALQGAGSAIKQLQIQVTTQSTAVLTRSAGLSSQQITSAQFTIRRKL